MLDFFAIIGVLAVVCLLFRLFSRWLNLRKAETIIIGGRKTTLNRLFAEVGTEIGIPAKNLLPLIPYTLHAAKDIKEKIHESPDIPYQAVIAYLLAGIAVGHSAQCGARGDICGFNNYQDIAGRAKDYADSFAPPGYFE